MCPGSSLIPLVNDVPTLDDFGRLWAEANAEDSAVARVALQGYAEDASGWPDAVVEVAINACNAAGADSAGVDSLGGEKKEECRCLKGQRCMACIERDGLTKAKP